MPVASRTIVVRKLKGLEDVIGMTVVDPCATSVAGDSATGRPSTASPIRCTMGVPERGVPEDRSVVQRPRDRAAALDTKTGTAVNNESSEIIRMLNAEFNAFAANPELDLYPEPLRAEIDALNERIYDTVNNGVYRSGFATTQGAYESAVTSLFASLDWLEERLGEHRYLTGDQITEADWRLAMTLFRFDPVYVGHFKCNIRRIADYPNLWGYTRELYQQPGSRAP